MKSNSISQEDKNVNDFMPIIQQLRANERIPWKAYLTKIT